MKNILFVTEYFTPGFLGGGPIQSSVNLITRLSSKSLSFNCITNSHDLGQTVKYKLSLDVWHARKFFNVLYTSRPLCFSLYFFKALFSHHNQILYLNSFFAPSSLVVYFLYFLYLINPSRIVIAPRGELYPGALSIKSRKKYLFLAVFRIFSLIRPIFFMPLVMTRCYQYPVSFHPRSSLLSISCRPASIKPLLSKSS